MMKTTLLLAATLLAQPLSASILGKGLYHQHNAKLDCQVTCQDKHGWAHSRSRVYKDEKRQSHSFSGTWQNTEFLDDQEMKYAVSREVYAQLQKRCEEKKTYLMQLSEQIRSRLADNKQSVDCRVTPRAAIGALGEFTVSTHDIVVL